MLILGIETSARQGSIALCDGARLLAASAWDDRRPRQGRALVGQIDELFRSIGAAPRACQAVAVSIGPGSFTGLRIGVVCAKTLAYATDCPLIAVDTFQSIVENCPRDVDRVHVLADAQRQDLFVGTYQRKADGEWAAEGPIQIVPAASWLGERDAEDVLMGPGLEKCRAMPPEGCRRLDAALWVSRAEVVAAIGLRRLDRGEIADPVLLEPFYVRRSAAEEKFDGLEGSGPI